MTKTRKENFIFTSNDVVPIKTILTSRKQLAKTYKEKLKKPSCLLKKDGSLA
ncbi:hypothetical protein C2W64_01194 [Brevibacillus laterosporus]|nr:hypothetical protein C2W64_01194 [Brevibacillus laterosporus]